MRSKSFQREITGLDWQVKVKPAPPCPENLERKLQTGDYFLYNLAMEIVDQDTAIMRENTQPAMDDVNSRLLDVLALVKNRDESALAQFYDMTSRYVYGLAVKICVDSSLAEEVTSDVYVHVWQNVSAYDPARARVLTWVMMLCRSRAIDALRRQAKHNASSEDITAEDSGNVQGPVEILQALERESEMHKAVSQLEPEQRQLLSLAFFRGYSHQQIAEYTELPLGTVKTHIRNAVIHLKNKLQRP